MMPELSIVLVSYNEREYLRGALRLLTDEFPAGTAEVIVVDNQSNDGSLAMVKKEFPTVVAVDSGANLMYGKGNNVGFERASGAWLLVLNPDVTWIPGALRSFFAAAKRIPNLGAAGPRVTYPDGRVQATSHRRFPSPLTIFTDYCLPLQQLLLRSPYHPNLQSSNRHATSHPTATMTGVCLLVPRTVYEAVGGFDPEFSMYLEETDWQRRMAAAGYDRWYLADSSIVHYGSAQKSFAQASRHYLWGLERYTAKHWPAPARRLMLISTIWTAVLISDILLLIGLLPSPGLGRAGRRIRHYFKVYVQLSINLFRFPTASRHP